MEEKTETESLFVRNRYELSKSAMRALTENARKSITIGSSSTPRDWFTYFETTIHQKASEGESSASIHFYLSPPPEEVLKSVITFLEKHGFEVSVYEKKVWIEW